MCRKLLNKKNLAEERDNSFTRVQEPITEMTSLQVNNDDIRKEYDNDRYILFHNYTWKTGIT